MNTGCYAIFICIPYLCVSISFSMFVCQLDAFCWLFFFLLFSLFMFYSQALYSKNDDCFDWYLCICIFRSLGIETEKEIWCMCQSSKPVTRTDICRIKVHCKMQTVKQYQLYAMHYAVHINFSNWQFFPSEINRINN